jgi:predicted helicase
MQRSIFRTFSLGISTNRDLWVYDDDRERLQKKVRFLNSAYNRQKADAEFDLTIKWSRNLKRRFAQGRTEAFSEDRIVRAWYRPFCKRWLYDSELFVDEGGSKDQMFPVGRANLAICFSDVSSRTSYCVLAVDGIADLHFGSAIDAYQQVPLYIYENGENRADNITDWAFDQFSKHYQGRRKPQRGLTKEAIFHYVYAVLHNPMYREKYALNLIREFPRIPFYRDFWQWADHGVKLVELHTGYELVKPWPLERIDLPMNNGEPLKRGATRSLLATTNTEKPSANTKVNSPKAILKADKKSGRVVFDSQTSLSGIPPEAWEYKLGTRCALEWILDQYKEGVTG